MKGFQFLLLIVLCSCSPKIIPAGRDSVRVETRIEYIERIDTAYIELPKQTERIITKDTCSHLENDFASSDASYSGGYLAHNLMTKVVKVPIEYRNIETVRDSIIYRDIERVVSVKQPLPKLVKCQIMGFWILLVGLAIIIYFKIRF